MGLLNEEQQIFVDQVRRMVADKVEPRAAEIDKKGEFPWDMKELFQGMGLLGLSVPEQYGGCYQEHRYVCLAVEEIAKACVSSSLIVQVQSLGWEPILIGGNEAQKKKYGPQVASGEKLTSYGLTEVGAGSDSAAMHTKAVKKGDRYIINGIQVFYQQWACSEPDQSLCHDGQFQGGARDQRVHRGDGHAGVQGGKGGVQDGYQGIAYRGTGV